MTPPQFQTVVAFALASASGLLFTYLAVGIGKQWRMFVRPRLYGRRRGRVSVLGGAAVVLATALAVAASSGISEDKLALLAGGSLVFLVGFLDDRRSPDGLSSILRFLVQVAAGFGTWWFALRAEYSGPVEAFFAVLVLVGCANAFNLLDNMDGVAGATALGTGLGIAAASFVAGGAGAPVVSAALAGAALGFLRFNFRRAKVYLGDGGALFLGFMLAGTALETGAAFRPGWELVAVVTLLAVAATDGWVALFSRHLYRRPLFRGGVDHLSHRLVRLGLSSRQAATLHGIAAMLAAGVAAAASGYRPELMVGLIALYSVAGGALLLVHVYPDARPAWIRRLTAAAGTLVLATLLLAIPSALSAAAYLQEARQDLEGAGRALLNLDAIGLQSGVQRAGDLSDAAHAELRSPLTRPARLLPLIGDHIEAAEAIAFGASSVAHAAEEASGALGGSSGSAGSRLGLVGGAIDAGPWKSAAPRLGEAAAILGRGIDRVEASGGSLLPPLSGVRSRFLEDGARLLSVVERTREAADLLPELFGSNGAKTWFLVIQNPVELRATGGFVGAFGILRAEGGRLRLERLDSNLALPVVTQPPEADAEFLARYERFAVRTMWQNVNMTPHFPTAARLMSEMWRNSTGEPVDGVIAMDADGLAKLLAITGPVTVPELGEVNRENFLRLALNEAYIRFPEKEERVDVLLSVGREAWGRILRGNYTDLRSAARPISEAVAGRHIQIWIPGRERSLAKLGLDGGLEAPDGADYLMTVAQNAAANKVDYYSQREVVYRVEIGRDGTWDGRVVARITNETPATGLPSYIVGPYLPTDAPGLNRSYLSLYTSAGTGLTGARLDGRPVPVESHSERGLAVISKFIEILPQKSKTFEADLSGRLARDGEYRLIVRRQPALNDEQFRLEVIPPDGAVVTGTSAGMSVDANAATWEGSLVSDQAFFVRFGDSIVDRIAAESGIGG